MAETFEVIRKYRKEKNLSVRGFADEINSQLTHSSITHATVHRWEHEEKHYEPDLRLLFDCISTYKDWRAYWAVDCLKSMFPDLFEAGVIRIKLPQAE
jgi:hypothetical protein